MLCLSIGMKQNPGDSAGIKDSLLAWWDFQTDGGDSHSTNRDLTLFDTPTFAAGKVGNAMSVTVAAANYAGSSDLVLTPKGPRTWAGWIYYADVTYDYPSFVMQAQSAGTLAKVAVVPGTPTQLALVINGSTASPLTAEVGPIVAETWYFLVVTYDGAGNWTINLDNGTAQALVDAPVTPNEDSGFLLGNSPGEILANASFDSIGVWGRILTAAEQTALYNEGTGLAYAGL